MLKNIFRNRIKSSKSGSATPSSKDAKIRAHFNQKHGSESPATVVQLNNETSHHSERAIDVLPEKQTNFFLSSSDVNCASSNKRMASTSAEDVHKNGKPAPHHKEMDKENMNHVLLNEDAKIISISSQKHHLNKYDPGSLVTSRPQRQAASSLPVAHCTQMEVVKQFNERPDILLIEDGENVRDEFPPQSAGRGCLENVLSDTHSGTVSLLQPAESKLITATNNPSQQCSSDIAFSDADNTSYFDEVIPQLVPISLNHASAICQADKKQVEPQAIEFASSRVNCRQDGNESEMYILTDSFLDYSSASFMNVNNRTSCSDIMVADDYMSGSLAQSQQQRLLNLNVAFPPKQGGNFRSWICSDEKVLDQVQTVSELPKEDINVPLQVAGHTESKWRQKTVQEWTSEEVLMWVADVGLIDYYETFQSNGIVGRDLSVISIKLLDRLEVFGQNERERVLSCLYRLHSCEFGLHPTVSGSCSTDVAKQLNFDERSLAPSTNNTGSSWCRSSSISVSNNSSNTTAASVRQSTTPTSLVVIPSEMHPDKGACKETLESEITSLLERVSMLEKAELAKQSIIEALQKDKSDLETQLGSVQSALEGKSIHHLLSTSSTAPAASIVAVTLTMTKNASWGFMLGLDSSQQPIIKHVEPSVPLKKGDRLLEVNGYYALNLSEQQLYKQLASSGDVLKVVVIRLEDCGRLHTSEEFEALRDDLEIALMECEAVQQENKDLVNELNRLKRDTVDAEDMDSDISIDEISALDDC